MLKKAEASRDASELLSPWSLLMTSLRQRMIEDLKIRNRSPKTIDTYVRHVAQFARHFGRAPDLLGPEEVRQYQLHLLEKKISFSTLNQCICSLRFLYGITLGRPELLPRIAYGKRAKTIPQVLSRAQVLKLLQCIHSRCYRILLTTIYATGLRLSEALHLRVTDIDSQQGAIRVTQGKGNKQRLVPLSPALLAELREWWREHRNPQWLFPGKAQDRPLDSSAVQKACQRAVDRAGLAPGVSAHTLRHTFATELLEADVDLLTIQKILGHADLKTTLIYTHVRRDRLHAVSQVQEGLPLEELCRPAFPLHPPKRSSRSGK
jgi:integrase/recombinase XerD